MATLDIDNPRHPLFLQPSNNSSNVIISIQLKGTENYSVWSKAIVIALRAKRKLGFIDGSCTTSQFIEDLELVTGIVYAENAHEVRLKSLWDEYGSLIPSLPVTVGTRDFIEHLEQQKLFQFLMGLNVSYGAIRSQILLQSPPPSVSRAFEMLINEENQRKVCVSNFQISLANEMNDSIVFMSTRGNQTKFKKFNDLYCEYCYFKGHIKDTCYKLHGYPPGYKGKRQQ
ncbi:uncharacterized protein [Nicotiana tomentosiformis]|uniref:uncharacterized protein n=1 Tax=Nicotiana tomentosiformis TaxID=4098 RepID=UPI00388C6963